MSAPHEIERPRCTWCGSDPLYVAYHDEEWGVSCRDDGKLFEFLILEGAQAGLSWHTILKRREGYRAAFANFNPLKVASFGDADAARLLADAGIIRNRLKIASAINNARRFLDVQSAYGSFANYLWDFVDGEQKVNHFGADACPFAESKESRVMSKDMKKRGFTFVGSTICYAYMQAVGLVDDHFDYCWKRAKG